MNVRSPFVAKRAAREGWATRQLKSKSPVLGLYMQLVSYTSRERGFVLVLAFVDRSVRAALARATLARAALGGTGEDARLSTNNKKSPALAGLVAA